jgi:DNA (cytosine-5)-methyltransferase 1
MRCRALRTTISGFVSADRIPAIIRERTSLETVSGPGFACETGYRPSSSMGSRMSQRFGIVDLFAGPGGLSEGFSACRSRAELSVRLSIEMDRHAVRTLRLRTFLRSFEDGFPKEYYSVLDGAVRSDDTDAVADMLAEKFPKHWRLAESHSLQLELGKRGAFDKIKGRLDGIREEHAGNTILIGGPPCQAYSLVGRARNRGTAGYVAEEDGRHFLYREYVRILERLKPAAFVMENVKGILSSKVQGRAVFQRILEDLSSAAESEGGYRLYSLASGDMTGSKDPHDFIVRAEDHGVPQERHRVFIVGVRQDIARRSNWSPALETRKRVSVGEAIGGLPRLRAGTGRGDSLNDWRRTVRAQADMVSKAADTDKKVVRRMTAAINNGIRQTLPRFSLFYPDRNSDIGGDLGLWLRDEKLTVLAQHETRGHMASDLGRYGYAAAFADVHGSSPKLADFPGALQPDHKNRSTGKFADRFRVQLRNEPSKTVVSHISKDGHYFIHPDPAQCRSLTVREAARLQTFPDNYLFCGPRTEQFKQVGNAVPPYLARQIAEEIMRLLA